MPRSWAYRDFRPARLPTHHTQMYIYGSYQTCTDSFMKLISHDSGEFRAFPAYTVRSPKFGSELATLLCTERHTARDFTVYLANGSRVPPWRSERRSRPPLVCQPLPSHQGGAPTLAHRTHPAGVPRYSAESLLFHYAWDDVLDAYEARDLRACRRVENLGLVLPSMGGWHAPVYGLVNEICALCHWRDEECYR